MARYYFHLVHFDSAVRDPEGSECADLGVALNEAVLAVFEVAIVALKMRTPFALESIVICDTDGIQQANVVAVDALAEIFPSAQGFSS
jgi:hypothetical protein